MTTFTFGSQWVPTLYPTGAPTPYDESLGNYVQFFPVNAGDSITWSYSAARKVSGASGFGIVVVAYGLSFPMTHLDAVGLDWTTNAGATTHTVVAGSTGIVGVYMGDGGGGPTGGGGVGWLDDFTIVVTSSAAFCSYGTRVQSGKQALLVITEGLIAAAAIAVPELAWLEVSFGTLVGLSFVPDVACADVPPQLPTFTADDFVFGTQIPAPGSLEKFFRALTVALWFDFCECVPAPGGSPAPVTPVPPKPTQPPDVPGKPAPFVCDEGDICSALNLIRGQLISMSNTLALTRRDVTLIQRQGVPFGYIAGASHSALSGSGDFNVSAIIGLAVTFTAGLGLFSPRPGDPDTYHQLGKISIGTADGWERSWQPTHSPYLILPISGAVTRVGWSFAPGLVATITELIREP
jgi:hypothetical protein